MKRVSLNFRSSRTLYFDDKPLSGTRMIEDGSLGVSLPSLVHPLLLKTVCNGTSQITDHQNLKLGLTQTEVVFNVKVTKGLINKLIHIRQIPFYLSIFLSIISYKNSKLIL